MGNKNQDAWGALAAILVVVGVMSTAMTMQPARITTEEPTRRAGGTTSSESTVVEHKAVGGSSTSVAAVDCEKLLDSMDAVFDHQRDMRQQLFAKRYPPSANPMFFFDPYEPEAVCLTEERFGGTHRYGSLGDGPKFVCGMDTLDPKDCLVYNVGSNNQIDFEQAISQEIGCEVHTFDPTLKKPYIGGNYSHFYPWGLGIENQTVKMGKLVFQAKSIPQIIKELGHTNRKIDILKIDCEGCEYTVMPVLFQAIQNKTTQIQIIDQIQIEMHAFGKRNKKEYRNLQTLFDAADDAGYRIFHKEKNHWGCDGYHCVEYSFVHKSFLRKANAAVVCNHEYSGDSSKMQAALSRIRR